MTGRTVFICTARRIYNHAEPSTWYYSSDGRVLQNRHRKDYRIASRDKKAYFVV